MKTIALSTAPAFSVPSLAEDKSALETYGDIAQFGIPLSAAVISIMHSDGEGLFQLTEGAVYTALATHTLKFAVNTERPDGGDHSWSSGHTSAAMQGAAYLQFRYGWEYGLPAYAAAGLVGYSCVEAERHIGATLSQVLCWQRAFNTWSLTKVGH
ncbi:phosphatase PAP2 family protein [Vibrio splendidus]